MSNIFFQTPCIDEFKLLEKVFLDVWNQPLLEEVFIKHINSNEHSIICAYKDKEIVGAVSSFFTISNTNKRRWEVDLIAVKSEYQGLGIGISLLNESLKEAAKQNVDFARAVVRLENIPSQRIFEKAMFKTDGITNFLQLWEPEDNKVKSLVNKKATYLPMDTLSYRGLWIENLFDKMTSSEIKQAIKYARYIAFTQERVNTGVLVSEIDLKKIPKEILDESKCHGKYNWWIYTF